VVLELREQFREVIDIQVVAFPQEGILKLPGMQAMMAQAMEMGPMWWAAFPTTTCRRWST